MSRKSKFHRRAFTAEAQRTQRKAIERTDKSKKTPKREARSGKDELHRRDAEKSKGRQGDGETRGRSEGLVSVSPCPPPLRVGLYLGASAVRWFLL